MDGNRSNNESECHLSGQKPTAGIMGAVPAEEITFQALVAILIKPYVDVVARQKKLNPMNKIPLLYLT